MAFWGNSEYENGVEVTYSDNCDFFRANRETGEYTEKISVYPGHVEHYHGNGPEWEAHDHWHMDADGNINLCHGMEERPWKDDIRG